MNRNNPDRAGRIARAVLLGVFLAVPTSVFAQETCEFEGSVGANTAAERFREITAETPDAEAMTLYQEALDAVRPELDGENAVAYLMATQAQLGLGNLDEALALIETFDELAPECGEYSTNMRMNGWVRRFNAGIDLYNASDLQAALENFAGANAFRSDLRSANNAALIHQELGDIDNAIATYRAGLENPGADADPAQLQSAINGLGGALLAEGRTDEALAAYDSYLQSYPDDAIVLINYALAAMDSGMTAEAGEIFSTVLSRDDLDAQQWVQVGVGLYNSEDYDGGTTAFGKGRAENPFNKEAMEGFVNASVQAGRPGPVLALADTLVQWYPYDQTNYQLLASALARADMEDRAMAVIGDQEAADIVLTAQMGGGGGGNYVVRGTVEARGASGTLSIPFEFVDAGGAVVARETLSVPAPPEGQTESFQLNVSSGTPIAGFRYGKNGS
ncbi:MAG: tetratricopeptide repeat protein [Gemmatimonadota bacterium]|nr:tetratricopeptide repeat protein [Gemmatimonadota bacterium]